MSSRKGLVDEGNIPTMEYHVAVKKKNKEALHGLTWKEFPKYTAKWKKQGYAIACIKKKKKKKILTTFLKMVIMWRDDH